MSIKEEGYLHDYIAVGIIGFGIGTALSGIGLGGLGTLLTFIVRDWGRLFADCLVSGLFAYIPGGFVAGYLNFRMHKPEAVKMEGLRAGIMATIAHFFITLLMTILKTAVYGGDFGTAMGTWVVSLVFAVIFYPMGGYLAAILEERKIPLPPFLRFSFIPVGAPPPPPPPAAAATCPTCGGPLTYIQQYQRWYCYKCQKYA